MFQQGHNQTVRIAVCVCAFCMLCAVQLCCWHCRYAILGAMNVLSPAHIWLPVCSPGIAAAMARVHSYEWVQDALLEGPEDADGGCSAL